MVKKVTNIKRELDEDDMMDEMELMDNVDDLNFSKDLRESNAPLRGSSAFVGNTAIQRGMTPEQILEQRIKLMSSESNTTDTLDRFSRQRDRNQSVIMKDRMKLLEKKIQRE